MDTCGITRDFSRFTFKRSYSKIKSTSKLVIFFYLFAKYKLKEKKDGNANIQLAKPSPLGMMFLITL